MMIRLDLVMRDKLNRRRRRSSGRNFLLRMRSDDSFLRDIVSG